MRLVVVLYLLTSWGLAAAHDVVFYAPVCIRPYVNYHYKTCNKIQFSIDGTQYYIPKNFETDLATIPRIAWPILSPAHSSLIKAAIVHDWFYSKTCDFSRLETDLIFYDMLRDDDVSAFRAGVMYYAVRWFGYIYYNEDDCE